MHQLKTVTYNNIDEVSSEEWNQLNCTSNVYFSPEFLKAFEISNPRIDFKYIFVSQNDKAMALGLIQTIELNIDAALP